MYDTKPVNLKTANLSYFCRGCRETVRGIPETRPVYHISEFHDDPWLIVRCPNRLCELSFVIYNKLNDRIFQVFPLPTFETKSFHEAIPESVREDMVEAKRCFHAGAYKASVAMMRRAVQTIVLDKIQEPGIEKKKLWEQIDELFTKGFITSYLKDTAHEIRHFGNFGAHPTDDDLDNTNREDAAMINGLLGDLVVAIYVTPYETEKLKKKRIGGEV